MPVAERSTRAQVQAYRYGVQRIERAVVTGASQRPHLHGPRHGLMTIIGAIIAAVVLAGFAVYGLLRPAPSVGDARVLLDTDSGTSYVVLDGVLHPTLNLASAMLAGMDDKGGSGGEVRRVTGDSLDGMPRGQLIGIPGAPNAVPAKDALVPSTWTVCDLVVTDPAKPPNSPPDVTTTVMVGTPPAGPADASLAALVTPDPNRYELLWGGRRYPVTMDSAARALGLDPAAARPISLGLLEAIPQGDAIKEPGITGRGERVSVGTTSFTVGDVVRVDNAAADEGYYLLLRDGIQPVTAVVADVLRAATGGHKDIPVVPPADLKALPESPNPIPVDMFPPVHPNLLDSRNAPGVCLDWRVEGGKAVDRVYPVTSLPLPAGAQPVPVPPGSGPRPDDNGTPGAIASPGAIRKAADERVADAVYVPPRTAVALGQTTEHGTHAGAGALFLLTDQGVLYPVADAAALSALGLGPEVAPAPSALLALLPHGPALDPAHARVSFSDPDRG